MAVSALTMLVESEAAAAGGVLLVALALLLAWLSTHVADRGEHFLSAVMDAGTHTSQRADAPEQQAPSPSPEEKPDDADPDGEATADDADLLLDIQSKQVRTERLLEEEEASEKSPKNAAPASGEEANNTSMSVRLKFLNDTEETAEVRPQDTVESLRSRCFSGRERRVKLIYQGQLLHDPSRTLGSLNITHNSVIHCHVSQALLDRPDEGPRSGGSVPGGVQAAAVSTSSLLVPVFVVVLAVVWYFRINYRQFFTAPATISLVGVTVFFSFLLFGMHGR